MKIVLELPDNWLDTDLTGNIEWVARTVRDEVRTAIVKSLAEQVKLPQVTFTADELRPLVADKLAERRASELWDKA